jgi:hypothetical protein
VQSFSKLGIAKSAKSGGGKQLICRLIQMPFGSRHVSKMSNEFSGQFVYVDASKIVELFTPKAENTRAAEDCDVDALAVVPSMEILFPFACRPRPKSEPLVLRHAISFRHLQPTLHERRSKFAPSYDLDGRWRAFSDVQSATPLRHKRQKAGKIC